MEKQLVKEVKGTPFVLIEQEDGNHIAVMGRYALTKERFEDEKSFMAWLETNKWKVTAVVAGIMVDREANESKTNKTN